MPLRITISSSLPPCRWLTAPSTKLVWFEKSEHEPFVDEPAQVQRGDGEVGAAPAWASLALHCEITYDGAGINVLGWCGVNGPTCASL